MKSPSAPWICRGARSTSAGEKLSTGRSQLPGAGNFETDLRNANAQLNALIAYLNAQTQLDPDPELTLEAGKSPSMTTDKKRLLGAVLVVLLAAAGITALSLLASLRRRWANGLAEEQPRPAGAPDRPGGARSSPTPPSPSPRPLTAMWRPTWWNKASRSRPARCCCAWTVPQVQLLRRPLRTAQGAAHRAGNARLDNFSLPSSRARCEACALRRNDRRQPPQRKLCRERKPVPARHHPRNELDDLKQQTQQQQLDLASARSELQQALEQGKGEYRQIADMELTNATVKYDALAQVARRSRGQGAILRHRRARARQQHPFGPRRQQQCTSCRPAARPARARCFRPGQYQAAENRRQGLRTGHQPVAPGPGRGSDGRWFDGERLTGSVSVVNGLAMAGDSQGSAQFPVTLSIPNDAAAGAAGAAGDEPALTIVTTTMPRRSSCRRRQSPWRGWHDGGVSKAWNQAGRAGEGRPPGNRRRRAWRCSASARLKTSR